MRKVIIGMLVLAVACLIPIISAQDARADYWVVCDINQFGPGGDQVYVMLTSEGIFSNTWFVANSSKAKEILATAMFASANGKKVTANVTTLTAFGVLNSLYVRN